MSTPTRREDTAASRDVYTIGHSNHPFAKFVELLRMHGVEAIADVRSHPYSRFNPQFSLQRLRAALGDAGIAYLFLGRELGARSDDPGVYVDGKVDYSRLARTARFEEGLARVAEAASLARVALMCAEKDPLDCHRAILVCPELFARGFAARHIREDGRLESRVEFEARLLGTVGADDGPTTPDLFPELRVDRDEQIARAYRRRGRQIAYAARSPRG